MGLVEDAFGRLFPQAEFNYVATVDYSGKFKPYNATVRKFGNTLEFSLSRSWEVTSEEIVIGLIQHLLVKVLRREKFLAAAMNGSSGLNSLNMQLYDEFIKGVSEVAAVSSSNDEALESSFARVNGKYFLGIAEKPNLRWGNDSFRRLASFDYHLNTITVSALFRDAPQHLLDYLMYHELLHKKLKFSSSNGRARHHGSEFKRLESDFEGSDAIEAELNSFVGSRRRRSGRKSGLLRLFSFR